jgi:raffinose/stachyose/melibiose transport system substrate-binding protein
MVNWSKRHAALAAAAVLPLMLAACGGDGGGGGGDESGGTLKLWHYESANGAMGIAWDEAIKIFEDENPDVKVEFERKAFEQIQQNAAMVLNSDEAPDLMEYNKGNATAGLLASQGLLTDITEQVEEYGWDEKLPESIQTTARYDDRGVMGSGDWYGVPNYGEFVMVYYNKDAFAKQGVEIPTTLAEFEDVLAAFQSKGITPLGMAGSEYPAGQLFYNLALTEADRDFVDAYQMYTDDVDFHGPEFTFGAETFAQWVEEGYVARDSASLTAEDMGVGFISGDYPMIVSGSWWYGRFVNEIKGFNWGVFNFPGAEMTAGSSGNLWVVPTKSENKEMAYEFIEITMRPEIQAILGNNGGLPVAADEGDITDEKSQELVETWNEVLENDGLAFYPDWPVPGYYDVLVAGFQSLINESATPAEVLDEIEAPYREGVAEITEQ